jgi:hypothetical protein
MLGKQSPKKAKKSPKKAEKSPNLVTLQSWFA